MVVGRWVYVAQQIAAHIVARRDALDTFLARLSSIDIRLAWVGWLLRLIVWSIRCLVDFVFRIVVLAQRALSREMEFQADLVAVSVTGSDALIHALHRLGAADQAWDRALDFANGEVKEGRGVQDLFAIQTRIIAKLRMVLNDPEYGAAPPIPVSQPESHRLFKATIAAPPRNLCPGCVRRSACFGTNEERRGHQGSSDRSRWPTPWGGHGSPARCS
jgi:hypothetical protein